MALVVWSRVEVVKGTEELFHGGTKDFVVLEVKWAWLEMLPNK
jgi:hypothetical protein